MLRDRNAPALSGRWNRWNRDTGTISEIESRVQSELSAVEAIESRVEARPAISRYEELRWLSAAEHEIRAEMEKRLDAYFKRKREKAA